MKVVRGFILSQKYSKDEIRDQILKFQDDYVLPEYDLEELEEYGTLGDFEKEPKFQVGDRVIKGPSDPKFIDSYDIKQFKKNGVSEVLEIIPPGELFPFSKYPQLPFPEQIAKRAIYYRYVIYTPKLNKITESTGTDVLLADEFIDAMNLMENQQSTYKPLTSQIINKFLQMCKDSVSFSHEFYSESVAYDADFLFDEVKNYNLQPGQVLTSEQGETIADCIGNGWGESTGVPKSFARTAEKYGVNLLSYEEI